MRLSSAYVGATPAQRLYRGEQLLWQRSGEEPDPVAEFQRVQEWNVAGTTNPATGPMTTAGNLLIVRANHRAMTNGLPASASDVAGNVWNLLGAVPGGGSGDGYMWYCENALPTNRVDVQINGGTSIARQVFVSEWSGAALAGALVDYQVTPSASGRTHGPATALNVAGGLVLGMLTATVSNRTFQLQGANYTEGLEHRANQSTLKVAHWAGAPAGEQGPQWVLPTTETATSAGLITATFRPAGG